MPSKDPAKNRAAVKRHYEAHKEYWYEKNKRVKEAKRQYIRDQKNKPCVDCTIQYPFYVMQFDHLKDKEFTISRMLDQGWKKIKEEIAKCEVVCANCHCIRTFERAGVAQLGRGV